MSICAVIFIASILLIGYAYFGFPVLVWLLARMAGKPLRKTEAPPNAVSVVIAAYNEAGSIKRRVREFLDLIDPLDFTSEVIVVSDGSMDGTDKLACEIADPRVSVIQQPYNMGKAMAVNAGVSVARTGIVVFADSRQNWAADAIQRMLENYADPSVGAVSGDLVLRKEDGSLAGVGLYWKLEKWIRRNESRLHSSVQVAGAICSVRRDLFAPLPRGTILDDVYWPLAVTMQGYRVIHDPTAQAFDRLPDKAKDEIRRKVRTLSGNFQLLFRRPAVVVPWLNPVWFNVICHKLLRLVVPWAMIAALLSCAIGPEPWLRLMLVAQLLGYGVGIIGIILPAIARNRLVNAVSSLLVLNAAALMSWFVYFSGQCERSWKKVAYNQGNRLATG